MKRKIFGELVGTALLIYLGTGLVLFGGPYGDLLGPALGWGLMFTMLVYTFGPLSGPHLNPVVTLMVYVTKRMPGKEAIVYVVSQLIGGLIGELALVYTYNSFLTQKGISWSDAIAEHHLGSTMYPHLTTSAAFLVELVITTILLTVILVFMNRLTNEFEGQSPIIVGLTVFALVMFSGHLTGTSMNPVRSLYPALFAGGQALEMLWVYLTAPFLAVVFAVLIDKHILSDE